MTYQQKAEAYVREKLDLFTTYAPSVDDVNSGDQLTLGQPIYLQNWLSILDELGMCQLETTGGYIELWFRASKKIMFNLISGQPATEADYQAFCEIVGISSK